MYESFDAFAPNQTEEETSPCPNHTFGSFSPSSQSSHPPPPEEEEPLYKPIDT